MVPRERVLAAMSHREPDRTPVDLCGGYDVERTEKEKRLRHLPHLEEYIEGDIKWVTFKTGGVTEQFGPYLRDMPEGATIDDWGVATYRPHPTAGDGSYAGYVEYNPLRNAQTVREFQEYPLPDMMAGWRHGHFEEMVDRFHSRNMAVVGQMSRTFYETAVRLRQAEEFWIDLAVRKELAECLLDRLLAIRVLMAERFAQAGVDILRVGDDVGSQKGMTIDPNLWRVMFKPRLARVIEAARRITPGIHVLYHSDGDIGEIIPDLIEIGITALNPIQPECMDPVSIKKEFGKKLVQYGGMSTQQTLAFGTREEVQEEVRERVETVGKGGGLVFCLTNVAFTPKTKENFFYFIEALEETRLIQRQSTN